MRRPFRLVAPDRLRIREGGGCMTIFGLPFFLAGVSQLLAAAGVIPLSNAGDAPRIVLILMGTVFTCVGGALAFGRQWTTIDRARRVVLKQRGLLVPMQTIAHPLDDNAVVVLGFEEGDSDTADRYPVNLRSKSEPLLVLCRFTQYAESRACAAAVAQHLRIDIEDASTDHVTRLSADQADLPLRDRLRLSRGTREHPTSPPVSRSEIQRHEDGVRIVMPMPGTHPATLVAAVLPLLVAVFLFRPMVQVFRQTKTPDPFAALFLGALGFIFVVLPIRAALKALVRSWVGRTIVTVSPEGLRIAERRLYGTRHMSSLAASEDHGDRFQHDGIHEEQQPDRQDTARCHTLRAGTRG